MQTLLANVERLAIAQQQYISKYNPGYNINLSQDEDGYIILEPGDPVSGDEEISLQAKTNISPTESSQTIRADGGYDGLSSVQINAIPGNYVGSTVTRKAAATYTPSETAQTIAAGQYLSGAQTISAVSSTYIGSGITRKSAATYTPGTTDQTIAAGQYLSGAQTIKGDANLVAANIASGVSIFGIQGTHSGGSGGSISLQAKTNIAPTESSQTITADSGYDGLSSVQINAVSGTYVGSQVPRFTLGGDQALTPTETRTLVMANGEYLEGGDLYIEAIPSTYVGSGITQRSSSDLTASGATVTVPAGYYSAQATKSVSTGSATAPIGISGTGASVTTGTNTLTLTKTVSVTPTVSAGYVSAGTAGNSSVSLTATVTTKGAATYYPSTSDQTISASQYLTGAQTIKAVTVSGLSAANIASGVTVKVGDSADDDRITSVTGTLAFQTYYTGSSAPSSSLGSNGDIYLMT